ncbi:hypothetical protein HOLDEFILI_01765 [Holdemania filiformis DSM 12042]|uniref:Uncharacterized protein n=1 Tax=Holdemania filiformis DSM 12042 TaxID=545696 RepID=B9Y7H0_9FIRM|nr:hypothetical protein HOLDEFILI_01765 [Holdemania filiformis DSM 12042]
MIKKKDFFTTAVLKHENMPNFYENRRLPQEADNIFTRSGRQCELLEKFFC